MADAEIDICESDLCRSPRSRPPHTWPSHTRKTVRDRPGSHATTEYVTDTV